MTTQDQLLLLDASSPGELRGRVADVMYLVRGPVSGGLADVAAALRRGLAGHAFRAAVVAGTTQQAYARLAALAGTLGDGDAPAFDAGRGVFAGRAEAAPAIGYLFPGQGADVGDAGATLASRFAPVCDVPTGGGYQQQIVASSLIGLRVLSLLGIEATAAAGHSLGELTALHWAGVTGEPGLLELVGAQSRILGRVARPGGAMGRVDAGADRVEPLLAGQAVVAGHNAPEQTVVAGPAEDVGRVLEAAGAAGLPADRLPVPVAFHTPAMAAAQEPLREHLAGVGLAPPARPVCSTVTGGVLPPDTDLRELLVRQVVEPVRFCQALQAMPGDVRLLVEVGPDRLLSKLAAMVRPDVPVVPLRTDHPSVSGALHAAAAAHVLGAPVRHDLLVTGPATPEGGTRP